MNKYFLTPGGVGIRTKASHPYSYDPITVYTNGLTPTGSLYTDRLNLWYDRSFLHDKKIEYFGDAGDYWYSRSPEKIQSFLRDIMEDPTLMVTTVEEQCNQATGYPVWFIAYVSTK